MSSFSRTDIAPSPRVATIAALAYAAMIAVAIGVFLVVREYGSALTAPVPVAADAARAAAAASPSSLHQLLIALTTVILVGRALGSLFARLGQPAVIGEVVGGVVLGPSLLGAIAPAASAAIFPPSVVPHLGMVSQLGVILYMFLVGVELNTAHLRGQMHTTVATSHASIVVPFTLGVVLALYLYPRFSAADIPFTSFALFIGIAMSITAFPVLARILADLNLTRTRIGVIALTCAAVDDVTAWCLLALVVGVVQAGAGQASAGGAALATLLTLAFIAVMFLAVKPWIARRLEASGDPQPTRSVLALALGAMLVSALITEWIGVHAIFGAFLLGAVIPYDSRLAQGLTAGMESLVTIVFLPAFFAFAGLRTQIGLLDGWDAWFACGLIVLIASVGKIGGTVAAARLTGLDWRHASGLGVLMNTRGLMQLIVLNVGLELGVITPALFTMMVIMALVTTIATTPVFRAIFAGHRV